METIAIIACLPCPVSCWTAYRPYPVSDARAKPRAQGSKKTVREPGKIVQIVLPAEVEDITWLNEIAEGQEPPAAPCIPAS